MRCELTVCDVCSRGRHEGPVVRIGAVRVRLSPLPATAAAAAAAVTQSAADCCCPRSRIPLRTPPPPVPNNSRGIFSRGWPPAAVYRSSVEWRQREPSPSLTGCFSGVCRDADSEDTRRLVDEEDDTLDRLSKFRFGGGDRDRARGAKRNPPHKKKPRSSDKTERLRELTEKLKSPPASRAPEAGPSTASAANPSAPAPPTATAAPPEEPREPEIALPQPSEDEFLECVNLKLPKPESRTIVGSYIQRTIPFRSASFSQVDFSPVDGKYIRCGRSPATTSKIPTLGTSSACLTLPRKKVAETSDTSPSSVSVTSSATTVVTESSNPSIDSAVGSSEWIFPATTKTDALVKPPNIRSLTHPLTRSRSSTEEGIPFSSIDGNGLRSLGVADRQLERLWEESDTDSVAPSEADNSNAQPIDSRCDAVGASGASDSCGDDNVRGHSQQEVIIVCSDVTNDNDPNNPIVAVENSHLNEYKIHEYTGSIEHEKHETEKCSNNLESNQSSIKTYVAKWPDESTLPSGEVKCIHTDYSHLKDVELPSQTANVETTANEKPGESVDPCNDNIARESFIECTTITTSAPEEKFSENANKRWSDDGTSGDRTSSEWPSSAQEEPQSPDDGNTRPSWPDRRWLERPRLVCQSSEERDDDSVTRGSPRRFHLLARNDSLSENESDTGDRRPTTPSRDRDGTASPSLLGPSDHSDSEGRFARSPHAARRYSKRPLRGPYGQMLEAEMKKPEANRKFSKLQYNEDLKFLENLTQSASPGKPPGNRLRAVDDSLLKRSNTSPDSPLGSIPRSTAKRKVSANIPFSAPNPPTSASENPPVVHIRTTSSPSQLEGCATKAQPRPSPQLLAHLLKGSSERVFTSESPSPLNHGIPLHHWKVSGFS